MLKCFCEEPLPLDSEDIYATKCGHVFHCSCLLQWLEQKPECPTCRSYVSSRDKFRLYLSVYDDRDEQEPALDEALQHLERTQSQLNQMMSLCRKKDILIKKLEKKLNNFAEVKKTNKDFPECGQNVEREELKHVLSNDWQSLDDVFDEPSTIREMMRSAVEARINPSSPTDDVHTLDDEHADSSSDVEIEDGESNIRFLLKTLLEMTTKISDL